MKISYNWLKQYINIDLKPDKLAEILTSIGLEVESISPFQQVKGGLEGFVVGEVISVVKHPYADKLSVTKVDIGTGELLNIVCGASNVAAGQKVIVATIGTTIYKQTDIFKIKKSKIRGEISEGMICAEDEMEMGTSHEGIAVLANNAKTGTAAKEYFNIKDDYIFEIGLTPNRIDAASHIGVARDLAAYLRLSSPVKLNLPSLSTFAVKNNNLQIAVEIKNTEACLRYSGISISNIKVKESPEWLKNSLLSIGLKPINNIVDITNFVLFETGQPLHAFDAEMIKGNKIIVRTLKEKEKFITLDDIERNLIENDLMICNNDIPMCIAGIMGGKNSGISNNTKNVFIESACFNPVNIRKTSKRLGITTDSSFRFERGTDINNTIFALQRASLLMVELAEGNISSGIVDVNPKPVEHFEVKLTFKNTDRLLGIHIEKNKLKNILISLDIKILSESKTGLILGVPTYKVDVLREADVIEEIIRIFGYNSIPVNNKVSSSISFTSKPDKEKLINNIAGYLSDNGFNEIMTNSLTNSLYNTNYLLNDNKSTVFILNPLSNELDSMRSSILFGGLESILYNLNRKNFNLKFFEFGNTYLLKSDSISKKLSDNFIETLHLSLLITGQKNEINWDMKSQPVSFYHLKSFIENILERIGIPVIKLSISEISNNILSFGLNYGYNDFSLVEFGKIKENILKGFDIKQEVFFADFIFNNLLEQVKSNKINFRDLSKFPEVKRDLALLVDKDIKFEQLRDLAFKTETRLLKKVSIFDIYENLKIGDSKKSYALTFILQDDEKTLTDYQVEQIMKKLSNVFITNFDAKIR